MYPLKIVMGEWSDMWDYAWAEEISQQLLNLSIHMRMLSIIDPMGNPEIRPDTIQILTETNNQNSNTMNANIRIAMNSINTLNKIIYQIITHLHKYLQNNNSNPSLLSHSHFHSHPNIYKNSKICLPFNFIIKYSQSISINSMIGLLPIQTDSQA